MQLNLSKYTAIQYLKYWGMVSFALLLGTPAFAQGPIDGYMKDKYSLDIALSYSNSTSNEYFGSDGTSYDIPYKAHSAGLYLAYGIIDKLDIVTTLAYVVGEEERNFQDMGIYLKYRPLYKKPRENLKIGLLFSSGYSFPVSNYKPDVTGALGQRAKTIPLKTVTQLEIKKQGFLSFTGAYHLRLDKVSNSTLEEIKVSNPGFESSRPGNFITLMLKGGMAMRNSYFDVFIEYQNTFNGVNYEDGVAKPSQLYAINYLKLGAGYFYRIDPNSGISINAAYIPKGSNIGNILFFSAGLIVNIFKRDKEMTSN